MDLNFNNVEPETVRVPVSFEDALAKFRSEAGAMGLKVGEVLVNDEVQRVPIKDQKPGKLTGWYALHEVDGMVVGAFGDWREAGSWTRFISKDVQYISMSTQKLINERVEASRLEMEKRREEASTVAQERLEAPQMPEQIILILLLKASRRMAWVRLMDGCKCQYVIWKEKFYRRSRLMPLVLSYFRRAVTRLAFILLARIPIASLYAKATQPALQFMRRRACKFMFALVRRA